MGVELGRLVQQRRHELGLSRRELADQSETSYPYVSQIETGDRDPSLKTMRRLSEVLRVPLEEMASFVAPEAWASESQPSPPMAVGSLQVSYDDSVELYRDKVLPSIERRLQGVPPLVRLELLAELTRRAAREAAEG